jgi:hypothetical protein
MILRKLEVVTDVCVHVAFGLMVMASVSGGQEIEVVDMAVAVMADVEIGTAVVGEINRVDVAVMADVETGTAAVVGGINRVDVAAIALGVGETMIMILMLFVVSAPGMEGARQRLGKR